MDQNNSIKFVKIFDLNSEIGKKLKTIKTNETLRVVILQVRDEIFSANDFDETFIEQIENFSLPIILTIDGFAENLLFEIVLASHLCIASESAMFEIGDKEKLKKQIGSKNAAKLNSIGKQIDAEMALDFGIINKITNSKNLEKESIELAERISKLAPLAIGSFLQAVNQGLKMDLEEGLKLETELFSQLFSTQDMKEGTSAFLEKRKPIFNGN